MKYFLAIILTSFCLKSCKQKESTKTNTKIDIVKEENISLPKIANTDHMILFDGGKILIGSNNRTPIEKPEFETTVAPFYLDENLVTVADFRKFVETTNYTTEAENFGDSAVFDFAKNKWDLKKGVTWEYPLGNKKEKAEDNHPVTHVSWNDANAYAKWIGKRLPSEIEWEFAAKNGKNLKYPWGNYSKRNDSIMANTWEGKAIQDKKTKDGYLLTSPIAKFSKSNGGIYDMVGNVWQWTNSVFEPYDKTTPFDKNENTVVVRGGSFMFDQALELSFTTTYRAQNTKESSLFNTGFRCAYSKK